MEYAAKIKIRRKYYVTNNRIKEKQELQDGIQLTNCHGVKNLYYTWSFQIDQETDHNSFP